MIIFRYLTRQILQTTLALTFILLVVAVLGRLLNYLSAAAEGELDPGVLVMLMAYKFPDFLQIILPLALLLGILLAYGRMYAESEMTVLIACGISTRRLLVITGVSGLFTAVAVGFLTLYLTPRSLVETARLLEAQENLNEFDVMVPGLFQNLTAGARTSYAETVQGDNLQQVFMYENQGDRFIHARSARPYEDETGRRFILFRDGSLTEGLSSGSEYSLSAFEELGVALPPRDLGFEVSLDEQSMVNSELWQLGEPIHLAELQWRLSMILMIPILTLLAVPLSKVSPREGRFAKLVPAILLYLGYFGLLVFSRDLVADGSLPPVIGLWWVHLAFLGVARWLLGESFSSLFRGGAARA